MSDDGRGQYGSVPNDEGDPEQPGNRLDRSSSMEHSVARKKTEHAIRRKHSMKEHEKKHGRAVKFPDDWAFHAADMPYIPLTSYIVTIISQVYATIRVRHMITDFQDMSDTDNYEEVVTYCITLSIVTYSLNAVIMVQELALTHYFRDRVCSLFCSEIVQLPWMDRERAYYLVSFFAGIFMLTYYLILLFVGVISVFAFVVWILVDIIVAMCSTLGDSARFVNLLSLTNSAFDTYFRAGYFCADKHAIAEDVKWVCIWYFVLFFAQLNLMGVVAQQRYRMHLGLHNLHVEHNDGKAEDAEGLLDEDEPGDESDENGTWM